MSFSRLDIQSNSTPPNSTGRLAVLVGLLLTATLGCGQDLNRQSVQGSVKYNATAVEDGTISFIPQGAIAGPPITAIIENGRYRIEKVAGPPVGVYRIEIEGFRKTGRQIPDLMTPLEPNQSRGMIEEKEPYIPPKHNRDSKLTVEVTTDKTDYDFDLPR